ncbi:MAG: Nif3-like dinuclear metal center hexameric protein [Desulfuromonadaceae bacterium]|nr:Nif3-like dinuclear metal center hexameric protein [Desulfuromonadaceae bacterium]MDD2856245.1 Nif3-like dinuclear metal center hexameric protein [Desulfuromonadaceae bacterium]
MKIPKISDIVGIINKIAPASLAESWDNPGLQIGDPPAKVSRIMVALDPTPDVIDSAIKASCQLLVTHHPLIFKPLKSISNSTPLGGSIHKAIRAGLSIVSLHTNYDIADGGLNDLLARKIGLIDCVPLRVTFVGELAKLTVFVPEEKLDEVRSALFPFTARSGAYKECSFTVGGTGTFTPLEGAVPYIGTVGDPAFVSEKRLELLIDKNQLSRAVRALLAVHPYEEPAFDLYPLLNEGVKSGLGRVGRLESCRTLAEYAADLKYILSSPSLRYVGNGNAKISKVALCSGSGASLLHDAVRCGADVLVTGDVKYHEAREAEDMGISLIDAGHFSTEIIMAEEVASRLASLLIESGYSECSVEVSQAELDPFKI